MKAIIGRIPSVITLLLIVMNWSHGQETLVREFLALPMGTECNKSAIEKKYNRKFEGGWLHQINGQKNFSDYMYSETLYCPDDYWYSSQLVIESTAQDRNGREQAGRIIFGDLQKLLVEKFGPAKEYNITGSDIGERMKDITEISWLNDQVVVSLQFSLDMMDVTLTAVNIDLFVTTSRKSPIYTERAAETYKNKIVPNAGELPKDWRTKEKKAPSLADERETQKVDDLGSADRPIIKEATASKPDQKSGVPWPWLIGGMLLLGILLLVFVSSRARKGG